MQGENSNSTFVEYPSRSTWSAFCFAVCLTMLAVDLSAAPIEYHFTWTGSGTVQRSVDDASASMRFDASITDVVSLPPGPNGTIHFNPGLTGQFSGAGLSGAITDLTVGLQQSASSLVSFSTPGLADEFAVFNAPGLDSYDLRSDFGPAGGNATSLFDFALGDGTTVRFSGVSGASFSAVLGSDPEPPHPAAIPIPAGVWLFGTALIGLVGISERKKTA